MEYSKSNSSEDRQPDLLNEYCCIFTKAQLSDMFPFTSDFIKRMFSNTYVLFAGDSLLRTQYKDFVCLLQRDDLCRQCLLKRTNEPKFMGDVQTSQNKTAFNGPLTECAREYSTSTHLVRYKFVSRCLNSEMEKLLCSFLHEPPDVLFLNSCLWDVSRYGNASDGCTGITENGARCEEDERSSLQQYADRLSRLMRMLHEVLPARTMVVWVTTPPIRKSRSTSIYQLNTNEFTGRLVVYGNYISAQIVRAAGYDIADIDFLLRIPLFNRFQTKDGVHWLPEVVRLISQLLIGQVAKSWRITLDTKIATHIKKLETETDRGLQIYGNCIVQKYLCPSGVPEAYQQQDNYFKAAVNTTEGMRMCDEISILRYIQYRQKQYEAATNKRISGTEVIGASQAFLNDLTAFIPLEKPPIAKIIDSAEGEKSQQRRSPKPYTKREKRNLFGNVDDFTFMSKRSKRE